jgi:phosphoserine aminotransferase
MPVIKKVKKSVKRTKKALVKKPKHNTPKSQQAKIKHSVAYYDCCSQETKKGLKGVKITQICHHCKHSGQKLAVMKAQDREEEKQKIALA